MARTIRYGTLRRLVRAYHQMCARDDVRRHGLVVPAGVWLCHHCPQVSLDITRLRQHVAGVHSLAYRTGRRSSQCGSTSS